MDNRPRTDPPHADVNFDTINMSYILVPVSSMFVWILIFIINKSLSEKSQKTAIGANNWKCAQKFDKGAPEIVTRHAKLSLSNEKSRK